MRRPKQNFEGEVQKRQRRVVLFLLNFAFLFGMFAVVLSNQWFTERAREFSESIPRTVSVPMSSLVIARGDIAFGMPLRSHMLKETPWPRSSLPPQTFRRIADLDLEDGARYALAAITAGEPMLEQKISGPGRPPTLSATLARGMKAASIQVDSVIGVGGFILPNDRVDIIVTRMHRDRDNDDQYEGSYSRPVLQGIRVLAIDQDRAVEGDGAQLAKTVTVEVTLHDAQKLMLSQHVGKLSLVLRNPEVEAPHPMMKKLTVAQLFGDNEDLDPTIETVTQVTQAANQLPLVAGKLPSRTSTINVVRAITSTDYEVSNTGAVDLNNSRSVRAAIGGSGTDQVAQESRD